VCTVVAELVPVLSGVIKNDENSVERIGGERPVTTLLTAHLPPREITQERFDQMTKVRRSSRSIPSGVYKVVRD
jgi:hypothetical protein